MFSDPQISGLMQKMQGKMKKPEQQDKQNTDEMQDVKPEPIFKEDPKIIIREKKEEATKLFKDKKFEEAIKVYQECQDMDPENKVYTSNIIACLIELKQFEDALVKCETVEKIFDEEQVDFKIRARILQRKGTIFTALKDYAQAVKAFEDSLHECKVDAVKDLLIEAKNRFKKWEIEKKHRS